MKNKIPKNFDVISSPKTFRVFPTSIFMLMNKDFDKDNKSLIKLINNYKGKQKSIKKSNYGGYHSSIGIGNLNDFKKIKSKLIDSFAAILSLCYGHECIRDLKKYKIVKESFECMWFIVNSKNDFNVMHTHPRAWLSCVYYINLPKTTNILRFYDPVQARRQDADYCNNTTFIEAKEGSFIFFPGWLEHSVDKNKTNEDRIIISCNFRKPNFIAKIKEK